MRDNESVIDRLHIRRDILDKMQQAYKTQNLQLMSDCVDSIYYAFIEELIYSLSNRYTFQTEYDNLIETHSNEVVLRHPQSKVLITTELLDYGITEQTVKNLFLEFTKILLDKITN